MNRLGVRLFRIFVRLLLPGSLRAFWAEEMLHTFRMRQREVRRRWTAAGLPLFWLAELAGLIATAFSARSPGGWTRRTAPAAAPAAAPDPSERPSLRATNPSLSMRMHDLLSDVRFSIRTFVRRPVMMGLAAVSLALGIGASTAMFSVVDSVLLRPLPFEEPGELVNVYRGDPEMVGHPQYDAFAMRGVFSAPEYWWIEENQRVFESVGAYYSWGGLTLSGEGPPEELAVVRATEGLLPTLGVEPLRGRLLGPEDDPAGGARSVMLTEDFWESRFGRSPEVIGSELLLDDRPTTVVGVLPDLVEEATSAAEGAADVWVLFSGSSSEGNWGNHSVTGVVGRLRPGATVAQATDEVTRLMQSVPEEFRHGHLGVAYPSLDDNVRRVRPALVALILGAVLLLAVGCGNVAAILIGAGIDREQEIAVRAAMGAGRGRLGRQLLTESLVLAGIGAVGGVLVAGAAHRGLVLLAPPDLPRIGAAALDLRALGFAVAVSLVAGVLFGMVPALGLSRPDLGGAMKSSGTRGSTGGRGRLQSAVVVGELALATVLLVSGALLGRTFLALNNADLGLDADGLYAVRTAPPFHRFQQESDSARSSAIDGYFQEMLDAVAAVPGVSAAAMTSNVPLTGDRSNNDVSPEGWDPEIEDEILIAERRFVSEGYFETTGIRMVEGRGFDAPDNRSDAAPVMIISEGLARRVWPDETAVGKQVSFWGRDPSTVVGVAADLRDESLSSRTAYAFYVPARQVGAQTGSIVARVEGDPETVVPAIRRAVWSVDPDIPITRIASMEELVSDAVSQQRYRARLMVVFAALAAVFAMMGVYGVTTRSVVRRYREMGIRMALGAERGNVLGLILRQGARLAVLGAVIGIALSWWATGFLDDMLFGVSRRDPLSLVGIALLVGVASLVASLQPGRKAARADPAVALRRE